MGERVSRQEEAHRKADRVVWRTRAMTGRWRGAQVRQTFLELTLNGVESRTGRMLWMEQREELITVALNL